MKRLLTILFVLFSFASFAQLDSIADKRGVIKPVPKVNGINLLRQFSATTPPAHGNTLFDSTGIGWRDSTGRTVFLTKGLVTAGTSVNDSFPPYGGIFLMRRDSSIYTSIYGVNDSLFIYASNKLERATAIFPVGTTDSIYFEGHSYTLGTNASSPSLRWTSRLTAAMGNKEVNNGVGGRTLMVQVPKDYEGSPAMTEALADIKPKQANRKALFFQLGLIDAGCTAPAYTTTNYAAAWDTVLSHAINVKGWNPREIFIIGINYIGQQGMIHFGVIAGFPTATRQRFLQFDSVNRAAAFKWGANYIECFNREFYNDTTNLGGADSVHPNDPGYNFMYKEIAQSIGVPTINFSTGLTNLASVVTANLSTGIAGGQKAIGGTNANDTLSLYGNSATSSNTTTNAAINFRVGDSKALGMTILNNGNVGIGISNPATSLVVQTTVNGTGEFINAQSTGWPLIAFQLDGSSKGLFGAVRSAGDGFVGTSAGDLIIRANAVNIDFGVQGSTALYWQMTSAGHFLAGSDNLYDIGATGATRPRSIYIGTNGTFGGFLQATTVQGSATTSASLILSSNSSATKGRIFFGGAGNTVFNETNNQLGIGVGTPTARIHLGAGTTAASTSPFKFTLAASALMTSPEIGALEAAGNRETYTDSTGTRYIIHAGGTPTIAAGVGAGTSPTISITGIDEDGYISVTTGTLPTLSGTVATITFSSAYGVTPKCVLISPANSNASLLSGVTMVFVDQAGISTTAWAITAGTTALTAATAYKFYYRIMQ